MSSEAIRVVGIGKQYRIGQQAQYGSLRDDLARVASAPFRAISSAFRRGASRSDGGRAKRYIWALDDVSLEVQTGEVVGLIGRNGAGKSTLLKILSRITEPTRGHAEIRGRVGSLLEVGTGFHPELTGRENVYLNGAILGMGRAQTNSRFDEIVDFAGVEKFMDTPVKHYSDGMRARLAFAVAAHLEPEILLVDEVLAVGDGAFQKKCLNKMQNVGQEGRTVVFVSHSMPAITRLCERVILLDEGRVLSDGPAHVVVPAYLNSGLGTTAAREWKDPSTAPAGHAARLRAVRIRSEDGDVVDAIDIRRPVGIELEFDVLVPGCKLLPHYVLHNQEGVLVFVSIDQDPAWKDRRRPVGRYVSTGWIPGNLLAEGTLFVNANMLSMEPRQVQFAARDAVAFQVIDSMDGDSARANYGGQMPGVVRPLLEWSTEFAPATTSLLSSGSPGGNGSQESLA